MNWLLWAWRALPLQAQLALIGAGVVAVVGGLGGTYLWIDHQGYQRATNEWSAKYEKREAELATARADELKRQQDANDAAVAELQRVIDARNKKDLEAAVLEDQLDIEAAKDPKARSIALDADAVARYNRSIAK